MVYSAFPTFPTAIGYWTGQETSPYNGLIFATTAGIAWAALSKLAKRIAHWAVEHTLPNNAFIAATSAGVAWYAHEGTYAFTAEYINPLIRESLGTFSGNAAIPFITPTFQRKMAPFISAGAACVTSLTLNLITRYVLCIKPDEDKKKHAPNFPFISSTQPVTVPFLGAPAPMPSFKPPESQPIVTQEIETQTEETIPVPVKMEVPIQMDEVHIDIASHTEMPHETQEKVEKMVTPILAIVPVETVESIISPNQERMTTPLVPKEPNKEPNLQPAHPILKKLVKGCFWSCLPPDLED